MKRIAICAVCLLLIAAQIGTADALTLYAAHKEGDLNIRQSPNGKRVGYLSPGDRGEYIRQDGEWVLLALGIEDGKGWVNAQYLTVDPAAAGRYVNASGGRVRIRKTPGGKAAGWLGIGKTVEVLSVLPDENGELWGRTKKGYIALKYLERGG